MPCFAWDIPCWPRDYGIQHRKFSRSNVFLDPKLISTHSKQATDICFMLHGNIF